MSIHGSIIEEFIYSFYGYGNPAGPFWFIGMEEGGGESEVEVRRRLEIWRELGGLETVDVADFHHRLGMDHFFQDPVTLQHTWAQIIRLLLSMKGETADNEAVKAYQKSHFARRIGETCSLELLPLPSPSTRDWTYAGWLELPFLKNRRLYRRACRPWRAEHLRQMVDQYKPSVLVCYGLVYRKWYELIVGRQFVDQGSCSWGVVTHGRTLFALVKHPAARGVSNQYFEEVGKQIRTYSSI